MEKIILSLRIPGWNVENIVSKSILLEMFAESL